MTLAAALGQYARDVGGEQKGAAQLVARVNTYLAEANLASLRAIPVVSEIERVQIIASGGSPTAGRSDLFCIEELDPKDARALRPSLERERQRRLARRPNTQELRAELANRALASITPFDLQRVKTAMAKDHYASATIRQEFALLSADERGRLLVELARSRTTCLLPWLVFAIETTMRKSEILRDLLWSQINFEARTARLHDSKGGPRDVPLTQAALDALEELPRGQAWERVFPISAAALAKAWKRACERAGVENLHIHDLRHTGATIHARAFKGDIFLLRKVTGHKTIAQLARYVNYDMSDVLETFDAADARAAAKSRPQSYSGPPKLLGRPLSWPQPCRRRAAAHRGRA
ncbi:MAG: site-specific integrase [Burkholderiaceae bacterium]|nr:site-specific integrase [Burkholderiaceae bacterium]